MRSASRGLRRGTRRTRACSRSGQRVATAANEPAQQSTVISSEPRHLAAPRRTPSSLPCRALSGFHSTLASQAFPSSLAPLRDVPQQRPLAPEAQHTRAHRFRQLKDCFALKRIRPAPFSPDFIIAAKLLRDIRPWRREWTRGPRLQNRPCREEYFSFSVGAAFVEPVLELREVQCGRRLRRIRARCIRLSGVGEAARRRASDRPETPALLCVGEQEGAGSITRRRGARVSVARSGFPALRVNRAPVSLPRARRTRAPVRRLHRFVCLK